MNEAVSAKSIEAAHPEGWIAEMVQPTTDLGVGKQQPFLRKAFRHAGGPATLRISALGLYRAFINGKRVGDGNGQLRLSPEPRNADARSHGDAPGGDGPGDVDGRRRQHDR